MGYVEQSLTSGEQIILKARLHWGMFVGPVIGVLIAILIVIAASVPAIISPLSTSLESDADMVALACGGLAWLWLLRTILTVLSRVTTYFTTEFAVTSKRVIGKAGLLRRKSLEVMLSKVESIGVNEPLLGRFLNFGTIVVKGSGGTVQPFPFISNAMELRKQINTLMPAA